MAARADKGQTSPLPSRKRRQFLWPIPPLARAGSPRGIVNAEQSQLKGKPWRPPTPRIDAPIQCPVPVGVRPSSARPAGSRNIARGTARDAPRGQPSVLEALGLPGHFFGGEMLAGKRIGRYLPTHGLKDPQECGEGCYWRWLVHTLLEDVAALKRSLEETQEASSQLTEQKKTMQETISHNARLVEELSSMKQSLTTMRRDIPQLRLDLDEQQQRSRQHKQRQRELHEQQKDLQAAIRRSVDWQKGNIRKVQTMEREADEGRLKEQLLRDQMIQERDKVERHNLELHDVTAEYSALQLQVTKLCEKQVPKGSAKKSLRK